MKPYQIGDSDTRGWGSYKVTDTEYEGDICIRCEKTITVNPGAMLSIQSHDLRYERWTVTDGTLTVIHNGNQITLGKGEQIDIGLGDIHAMVNLSSSPCVVHEIQKGECSEDDIHRFWDYNGREVEQSDDPHVADSIKLCEIIIANN